MKLKINDTIKVISGKDKGKTGVITKIFRDTNRVLVDGLNTYKKHIKPQGEQQQGGLVTLSRPLPVSNVMLVCPHCKKPTRVTYQAKGSDKVRVCKLCQKPITNSAPAKKSK